MNKNDKHRFDPERRKFMTSCVKYSALMAGVSAFPGLTMACSGNAESRADTDEITETLESRALPVEIAQNVVSRSEKGTPYDLTVRAIEALGGMDNFVSEGETVLLLPNIAWDRTPEQAANTHPDVVVAIIDLCKQVGAKDIGVFCHTCHPAQSAYKKSGVEEAAEKAGAKVYYVDPNRDFVPVDVNGVNIKSTGIYRRLFETDRFINIPIAKVHSLPGYTLCMKNLLGAVDNRPIYHRNIHQDLADLNMVLTPDLNVLDASRILVARGPTGGSLADVRKPEVVIASPNPISADAVGMGLFDKEPSDLRSLIIAHEMGRGEYELDKLEIRAA